MYGHLSGPKGVRTWQVPLCVLVSLKIATFFILYGCDVRLLLARSYCVGYHLQNQIVNIHGWLPVFYFVSILYLFGR